MTDEATQGPPSPALESAERAEPHGPPVLSVVAPAFNEELSLPGFLNELSAVLVGSGFRHEILCVDDGSTDNTRQVLATMTDEIPGLRTVALAAHQGQSAAQAAGIRAARGEIVALLDADLQNDPKDLLRMLPFIISGDADCMAGVRARRRDAWVRRISSRLANFLASAILGLPFRDSGCGLKVARAALLRSIPFFRGAHRFLPALVTVAGGRVREMEVNHRPRAHGRSRYGSGLSRALVALRDAIGVRWLLDRRVDLSLRSEPPRS